MHLQKRENTTEFFRIDQTDEPERLWNKRTHYQTTAETSVRVFVNESPASTLEQIIWKSSINFEATVFAAVAAAVGCSTSARDSSTNRRFARTNG